MSNTITLSISAQDLAFLKENPTLSPTKLFRSAMILEKHKEEFMDIYDIVDYKLKLQTIMDKISTLQTEIQRRNERIDSLQDVLAQKELAERRIRKSIEENNGLIATNPTT